MDKKMDFNNREEIIEYLDKLDNLSHNELIEEFQNLRLSLYDWNIITASYIIPTSREGEEDTIDLENMSYEEYTEISKHGLVNLGGLAGRMRVNEESEKEIELQGKINELWEKIKSKTDIDKAITEKVETFNRMLGNLLVNCFMSDTTENFISEYKKTHEHFIEDRKDILKQIQYCMNYREKILGNNPKGVDLLNSLQEAENVFDGMTDENFASLENLKSAYNITDNQSIQKMLDIHYDKNNQQQIIAVFEECVTDKLRNNINQKLEEYMEQKIGVQENEQKTDKHEISEVKDIIEDRNIDNINGTTNQFKEETQEKKKDEQQI